MLQNDIHELIYEGDFVVDHVDNSLRQIANFASDPDDPGLDAGVFMTDGGVMSLHEIQSSDIRLESEVVGPQTSGYSEVIQ